MKARLFLLLALVLVFGNACAVNAAAAEPSGGKAYLYGEAHGVDVIMDKELELWRGHYDAGLRHLFVELPYATAQFLNLWMQAEDDTILEELYSDLEGTQNHTPAWKAFYQTIKEKCPETVFHGTDVAHQYATTGKRYEQYLKDNGLGKSTEYKLTVENNKQGQKYVSSGKEATDVFRETAMINNFIREFDVLKGEDVMGIYGSHHTNTGNKDVMAGKLLERYGDNLTTEDLTALRTDVITINGKDYNADYYGQREMNFNGYLHREFWQLQDAYADFKDMPKTGDKLPYDNYPMNMQEGQVYIVEYTRKNGEKTKMYYRSDGGTFDGRPSTEEFKFE